jgi:hypothetical protein
MSTSRQIDMDIQTATNDDFYRIQNLIEKFPGITTNLLISNLDLKMKEESLKVLFGRINRNRNTFYDLGPFVEVQDKWFIENVKQLKKQELLITKLELENEFLKQKLELLTSK